MSRSMIFAALAAIVHAAPALAQSKVIAVKRGVPTRIDVIGTVMSGSCTPGAAFPRISVAPKRGKAELRRETARVMNRSSECYGREIEGNMLYYTGASPGEDAVTVSMKIFNGRYDVDRSYTYRIRVQ